MSQAPLIPLKPIPIKDRISMIFVYYGQIDVKDGAFVVVDDVHGERKHIPVGSVACIMLEPGTRISHAVVKLAAATGTLLIWVGEAGVRLYSPGRTSCCIRRNSPWMNSCGSRWCARCLKFVLAKNRRNGVAWTNCGALKAPGLKNCMS